MNAELHPFRVAILRGPFGVIDPHPDRDAPPAGLSPAVDIHEGPEGMTLVADLPGAAEDGVTIQVEDNVLTLQARVDLPVPPGARLIHEEFRGGPFQRSFILSDEVDRDQIAAELKQGVLRITLPRAEKARTRRIEITSS